MNYTGVWDVSFDVEKPNGQARKPSDPSALMNIIGDFHFTPLHEGIRKTVKFFEENYPDVRL
jgi:GDP-L-fucose synthase